MDILWRVFHILTEPTLQCGLVLHFITSSIYKYKRINVKISKTRDKISVDIRIFFTMYIYG